MRHFLIDPDQLKRAEPAITGPDVRHMQKVLRLKSGDRIGLVDGKGSTYEARIVSFDGNRAILEVIGLQGDVLTPHLKIGVAQAFLKDKKMDLLLRQLTELGMTDWMPFVSERSVPRPDGDRLANRKARWEKIAREAVKQCRRPSVPRVHDTTGWDGLLAAAGDWEVKRLFWELADAPMSLPEDPEQPEAGPRRVLLVFGPEGGFSRSEAERAVAAGFAPVSLGHGILRAETAAVAGVAIAQYLFGDMGSGRRQERRD